MKIKWLDVSTLNLCWHGEMYNGDKIFITIVGLTAYALIGKDFDEVFSSKDCITAELISPELIGIMQRRAPQEYEDRFRLANVLHRLNLEW